MKHSPDEAAAAASAPQPVIDAAAGVAGLAPRFTVMTPTYNRAHTLQRVYDSLCIQSCQDFEWVVVDDGSTDDTPARVAEWARRAPFPLRYFQQPNQHKKTAFNHGVRESRGAWIVALDSDDSLDPSALAALSQAIDAVPETLSPRLAAIIGLCRRPDGQVVGERYPQDPLDATPQDITYRYRVTGEKFGCLRADVLRRFPFPEDIPGFVPESLVWRAIARAGYLTRFVNQVFRVYYDSPDALSHQGKDGGRHALGLWLLAHDTVAHDLRWFRWRPAAFLLAAARYTRFGLHLRRDGVRPPARYRMERWPSKLLVGLMAPAGWAWYWRDRRSR